MKIKVCGMKYAGNISEVAELEPDYLGFIFYKDSSRFIDGKIPSSVAPKRVGVFVNADIPEILRTIQTNKLNAVQLHGNESPDYCQILREEINAITESEAISIIKAFNISADFDFTILSDYNPYCEFFLFDAKGELPGGNGVKFDWRLLENYRLEKPFFLSGGIGPESLPELKTFLKSDLASRCHAIDVNSRFEDKPGLKNIQKLKHFKKAL